MKKCCYKGDEPSKAKQIANQIPKLLHETRQDKILNQAQEINFEKKEERMRKM